MIKISKECNRLMGSRKSILWMDLMRNKICPPPPKKNISPFLIFPGNLSKSK